MQSVGQQLLASLPWYDLPEIRSQTNALWDALKHRFRKAGLTGVPDHLNREVAYNRQWTSPHFFFGQACGYDVRMAYANHLTAMATPCYDVPGCRGNCYRSFVVVRDNSSFRSVEDLRGKRCVINTPTSHSGMNVLRALVAPIHCDGRFFGDVQLSGAHEQSLQEIQSGRADVAAVDCVTWALLSRYRPGEISGTRIIHETDPVPAPPYVTAADVDAEILQAMRTVLTDVMGHPRLRNVRKKLMIADVEILAENAYHPIERLDALANFHSYFEIPGGADIESDTRRKRHVSLLRVR